MRVEAPIEAAVPVENVAFKPVWLEERQAYVCQRTYKVPNTNALQVETYGARLNGKFSPMFLFEEAAAQRLCETLNAELPLSERFK